MSWLRPTLCALATCVGAHLLTAAPTGEPHAPRSGPAKGTRFTSLPSEQTGITAINRYDDPAMWAARYREFTLGAIGTGVGIGNLDTDSRPDLVVVLKTQGVRLYRNEGDFRFTDRTVEAGLALPAEGWYQGVALADVNNDGHLDLYVCRFNRPNLLFINQGDGTFREEAAARGLALVDASGQAAFCDYDRDGWLDVYVQTNLLSAESRPNGQPDRLFRNQGDGTFVETTAAARLKGETQGHSATWWDYDEDGWPDLYVANDFRDPDFLWRNRGDGTFSQELSRVVPSTPHSSMGADLGDLNNDGHVDLLVADMAATSHEADHRGMARVRAGLPDGDNQPQSAQQYMRNAVFLNTGAGRMEEVAWLTGLPATDWTWTVRLEDFDEDGWVDAFFTNGMVRELHNADVVKKMGAFESLADRIRVMRNSPVLVEPNLAFHNRGDLQFTSVGADWGLDLRGVSFGSATGDLDGDGDLDLVVANMDGAFTLYRNDTQGRSLTVSLRGQPSNRFGIGAVARLDSPQGQQTRVLLPTRGYLSSHEPLLHFGLGEGQPGTLTITWPNGGTQRVEGLATGFHYTITEESSVVSPPPDRPWFSPVAEERKLAVPIRDRGINELSRQPLLTLRQNRIGPSLTIADLDGDGHDEAIFGGSTGEAAKALSRLGDAYLSLGLKGVEPAADLPDAGLLALDADADGDLDLLVTKGGNAVETPRSTYQPVLYLNDGKGQFTAAPAALPSGRLVVGASTAADIDQDGDLDVFLGARSEPGQYPLPGASRLLRNDHGTFTDVTAHWAPDLSAVGLVTSALWSDLNNDGRPDLVVASEFSPLRAWLNDGTGLREATETLGLATVGAGLWTSLTSADVNHDGIPDLIAGNLGLNTPLRASPAEPYLVWPRVAEPGGRAHLLETEWSGGKLYPSRGYAHLTAAFPSLARRYPGYDAFAAATLDELIPATWRSAAAPLQATELRQGVWLSQTDGRFRFAPFPAAAQVAPLFSWIAFDADGDGQIDLLGAGNSFAPIPEFGRFSGGVGVVLRGDGRGHFTRVSPGESGWLVTGDAKAAAWLDLGPEAGPALLVSRHHERSLAWQPTRGWRAVRLQGPAGNPQAVGAKVTLVWSDGHRQSQEVRAGEGHLTQAGPTLFFGERTLGAPTRVHVRWPQGTEHEYAWPATDTLYLSLTPP